MNTIDRERVIREFLAANAMPAARSIALDAAGAEIGVAERDQLLAKVAAGEHVELTMDVLAFEQRRDEANRNGIRFREGMLIKFGRTGVGTPFLRDHEQDEVEARAGTVTASRTEKRGEGDYVIRQTVKVSAPWAVDLALRGLLGSVSIGARPTGPVECSICGTEVLTDCWHFPLDTVDGKDGPQVCEWVFTDAELIETSVVNVPAVPSARIQAIRAVLSAGANRGGRAPQETNMKGILIGLLGLAATAGESEITNAVRDGFLERDTLRSVNAELAKRTNELEVELKQFREQAELAAAAAAVAAEEAFISEGISTGKVGLNSDLEKNLRALFKANQATARSLLASMPRSTPVGAERQSDRAAPPAAAASTDVAAILGDISPNATLDGVASVLAQMGVQGDAAALIRKHTTGKEA